LLRLLCLPDEPVHLAAVEVGDRRGGTVRAALVEVVWIVEGGDAGARMGIGHAGTGRDAVGTGIGAEVGVEASVLLHDHHDVANLVNTHGYRQDGEVSASRHAQVVVAAGPRQESSDLQDAGVVKATHDVELRAMADSRMADSPPVVTAYPLLQPDQLPFVIGPKPSFELDPLAEIGRVRRD